MARQDCLRTERGKSKQVNSVLSSETLTQSYPGTADSVPVARHEVVQFALRMGADAEKLDAIRLAVSEALTNVVVHAYRTGPGRPTRREVGQLHVTASLAVDELWVLIGDDGEGLSAQLRSPGLGVGLALIAQSSDGLTIMNRATGGTEIRMCFSLGGNAADLSAQERGSSRSANSPASPRFSTTT